MDKSQNAKKKKKKEPAKTPKEKKAEKRMKKAGKRQLFRKTKYFATVRFYCTVVL